MLYSPPRHRLPRYRREMQAQRIRRAFMVGMVAACTVGAFAVGAATQRVENSLARTDQCVRACNDIPRILSGNPHLARA